MSCSKCDILGKNTFNIMVVCQTCSNRECYQCLKESRKLGSRYFWQCSSCMGDDGIEDDFSA